MDGVDCGIFGAVLGIGVGAITYILSQHCQNPLDQDSAFLLAIGCFCITWVLSGLGMYSVYVYPGLIDDDSEEEKN